MSILCPSCGHEYDVTLFQFKSTVACDCGAVIDPWAAAIDSSIPETVEIPVDGTLDLHTFLPSEVKDLVPEYLRACAEKGIVRVRIVHGKGDGSLLKTVHAILGRTDGVESFELAGSAEGGWGATIVLLTDISGARS